MLTSVIPYVPDRVLITQHEGEFGLDDVYGLIEAVKAARAGSADPTLPLHTIIDMSGCTGYSREIMHLKTFQPILKLERYGWTLVIDPNQTPVVLFIGTALLQIMGAQCKILKTADEVFALLAEIEPGLPLPERM